MVGRVKPVRIGLFSAGKMVWTNGVNTEMAEGQGFDAFVIRSMARHMTGDWGDICEEDKHENERALTEGDRLFSAYEHTSFPKIWIITEADRSVTTVLFPEEY